MVENPILNYKSVKSVDLYKFKEKFGEFLKVIEKLKLYEFNNYMILGTRGELYLELEDILLSKNSIISNDLKNRLKIFLDRNILYQKHTLSKDPNYSSIEYLFERDKELSILGYTDLFKTFMVSWSSQDLFCVNILKFLKNEMIEECNEVCIKNSQVDILNIYSLNCINNNLLEILNNRRNMFLKLDSMKFNIEYKKFIPVKKMILSNIVLENIRRIDNIVYEKFKEIIFDLSNNIKSLENYSYSDESDSVKQNERFKDERKFTFNDGSRYIYKHLKNFPNGHRMYIEYINDKYYVGYIGPHLKTQKHN